MMDYNNQQENNNINKNSVEYRWDGNSYRAVYNNGSNMGNDYYSNQNFVPERKEKTKSKKGLKIVLSAIAIILCCALVSGGTLMAFMTLVNEGKIAIVNNGTDDEPVFTITKLIEAEKNDATDTTDTGAVSKLSETEIAEKVLPSIVLIENYQITNSSGGFGFSFSQQSGSEVTPAGEGSGIIASEDGYIITNAHVVEGATSLKVKTYSGETYEATLVGSDKITDLAVIKIEAENLPYAQFGSSDDLKVGEKVLTAGNPGGSEFGFSVTVGYVSALNRTITSDDGYSMQCIQTDAAVNPGNSGGALVNEYGMVIGIVSSKIVSESFEGLGFAIPINEAQVIISDLRNYGYVKDRAAMGISGTFIDSVTARFYGLERGWYVSEITNTSVSDAGIQKGDVIVAIDDKELTSSSVVSEYLLTKKPGDTVTVTVSRALSEETFTATVTLVELKNS